MITNLFLMILIFFLASPVKSGELENFIDEPIYEVEKFPSVGTAMNADSAWSGSYYPLLDRGFFQKSILESASVPKKWAKFLGSDFDKKIKEEMKQYRKLSSSKVLSSYWEGYCHAWALASVYFPNPKEKLLQSQDGNAIHFHEEEIKLLLTEYASHPQNTINLKLFGDACRFSRKVKNCLPMSAMEFHVILGNYLGLKNKVLIADVDPSPVISNNPILRYLFRPIKSIFNKNNEYMVEYETIVEYLDYYWLPPKKIRKREEFQVTHSKVYRYVLTINQAGVVTDSFWLKSSYPAPDFFWTADLKMPEGDLLKLLP